MHPRKATYRVHIRRKEGTRQHMLLVFAANLGFLGEKLLWVSSSRYRVARRHHQSATNLVVVAFGLAGSPRC